MLGNGKPQPGCSGHGTQNSVFSCSVKAFGMAKGGIWKDDDASFP